MYSCRGIRNARIGELFFRARVYYKVYMNGLLSVQKPTHLGKQFCKNVGGFVGGWDKKQKNQTLI